VTYDTGKYPVRPLTVPSYQFRGRGVGAGWPQASSNAGLCWALPEKLMGVLVG